VGNPWATGPGRDDEAIHASCRELSTPSPTATADEPEANKVTFGPSDVLQNPTQRCSRECLAWSMKRYGRLASVRTAIHTVASAPTDPDESVSFKRSNDVADRHGPQLRMRHTVTLTTGIDSARRRAGSGSPCAIETRTYASAASWICRSASSRVLPHVAHPGRSGTCADQRPSSLRSSSTGNMNVRDRSLLPLRRAVLRLFVASRIQDQRCRARAIASRDMDGCLGS